MSRYLGNLTVLRPLDLEQISNNPTTDPEALISKGFSDYSP